MTEGDGLSPGDEWPYHYRGFSLQVSPSGEVWWQLYQGTDRLVLEPAPEAIVERLLEFKRTGGRIHVTEQGDVLTRIESDDGEYDHIYVGSIADLDGELIPPDAPTYSIDLRPEGLEAGDLWPSVYDGSRYSFAGERFWWHSGDSHKRHPVPDGLPERVERNLRRYKPDGGSFRVLPWGDVITLVPLHLTPEKVTEQFGDLPRVVRNIIKLRKSRDVEMLPLYIGTLDGYELNVEAPTSLTDRLSEAEQEELASWAENLGPTSGRSTESHRASQTERGSSPSGANDASQTRTPEEAAETTAIENEASSTDDDGRSDSDPPTFDDDPLKWLVDDLRESIHDSVEDSSEGTGADNGPS